MYSGFEFNLVGHRFHDPDQFERSRSVRACQDHAFRAATTALLKEEGLNELLKHDQHSALDDFAGSSGVQACAPR